jgi:translation initiation factor IF-3
VIDKDGKQVGIITVGEAQRLADAASLDLVEISPNAQPPVCKIIDYGKYRYQVTKKEKESKKSQHQVKVKEIKIKPNTDEHDLQTKLKHAKDFIEKGNKVRITCMFRGREHAHPEVGMRIVLKLIDYLSEVATPEMQPKKIGRSISVVLSPGVKKKGLEPTSSTGENNAQNEN